MSEKTRATLLERLRDGTDQLSWEEFFRCYWPLVYASARLRGCSDHTAEEVVQDVMLKVFQQRDFYQYDPSRGRFRDWLATVVRNQVAEYRRRRSARVRGQGGDSDPALAESESADSSPEEAWDAAFEDALLAALLDVLRREMNPRAYLAFELSVLGELSGSEVAGITGLSRNAVYKTRKRALGRLRQLGASYRRNGQLQERLKQSLRSRPSAGVERSLSAQIEKTMTRGLGR